MALLDEIPSDTLTEENITPDWEYTELPLKWYGGKAAWLMLQGRVQAEGGERYLVFGNFNSKAQLKSKKVRKGDIPYAEYDIDNLSLIPVGDSCKTMHGFVSETNVVPPRVSMVDSFAIYFSFNEAEIDTTMLTTLDSLVSFIKSRHIDSIKVSGFADQIGASSYNRNLSKARVWKVVEYITFYGVDPDQIEVAFYGEERSPIAANPDDKDAIRFRKVDVKVFY